MIKSVIFDWSGVLSDDLPAVVESHNEILKKRGHNALTIQQFRQFFELPYINFYKNIGLEVDPEEEAKDFMETFPKYQRLVKAIPQAEKTLRWLKLRGLKVIIFSAHPKEFLMKELKGHGWNKLVDKIYASNSDKREKIERLIEENEIEKERTLFVGDTQHDVETAKKAGIKSVAVLSGYDTREKLEREKPDFILKDVGELPGLIENLDGECNG